MLFLPSGFTLVPFWESLDGSSGLLGSNWVQIEHNGYKLGYWESLLVPPGSTLGGLGSSLIAFGGHLVALWVPRASKMDAAGDQADIAKTYENHWFLVVLGGWRGIWEAWRGIWGAWRSFGFGFWRTGWQLAGWLEGWLVVAGAGWEAGWPQGSPGAEGTRSGGGKRFVWGTQNHHIYQETHHHSKRRPGTGD